MTYKKAILKNLQVINLRAHPEAAGNSIYHKNSLAAKYEGGLYQENRIVSKSTNNKPIKPHF
jgi:hypothetical protein